MHYKGSHSVKTTLRGEIPRCSCPITILLGILYFSNSSTMTWHRANQCLEFFRFIIWCHATIIASINYHVLDGRLRCARFFKRNHKYSMVFRCRMFPIRPSNIPDYIFAQYSLEKIFLLEGRMMSMYFLQFSVRSMTRVGLDNFVTYMRIS